MDDVELYLDKWVKSRCMSKVPAKVPMEMMGNKEFVLKVIKTIPIKFAILQYVSDELKQDLDVVMASLKKNAENYPYIPKEFRSKKEVFLATLPYAGTNLDYFIRSMPEVFKHDRDIAYAVVKIYGGHYRFFADELKRDRELALLAAQTYCFTINEVPKVLKGDKQITIAALNAFGSKKKGQLGNGIKFYRYESDATPGKFIDPSLLDDKEVALAAVRNNGRMLRYFSSRLQDDDEVASEAISHVDEIYDRVGPWWELTTKFECSFQFVSPRLKNDRDFVLQAVKNNPCIYCKIPKELQLDTEIALNAIVGFPITDIVSLPREIFDDKAFDLEVLRQTELEELYGLFPKEIQLDKEVLGLYLKKFKCTYSHLPFELKTNEEIIRFTLHKSGIGAFYGSAKAACLKEDGHYYLELTFSSEEQRRAAAIIKAFAPISGKQFAEEVREAGEHLEQKEIHDAVIKVEITAEEAKLCLSKGSSSCKANFTLEDID